MPAFCEYINPNRSDFSLPLTNWIYNLGDKFELTYKMNSSPSQSGNWPGILGTAISNSAKLYLQFNLWSNRKVMNIAYNGTWAGDGNMSYSSPYDYENYYKLSADSGSFILYKGEDRDSITTQCFEKAFTSGDGTTSQTVTLFPLNGSNRLDMNLYGLRVWDQNDDLIHDYVPITDGVYDLVDDIAFTVETEGHINGPVSAEAYAVHFDSSNGYGSMPDQYFGIGESDALRSGIFIKTGKLFAGWDTSENAQTVVYADGETVEDIADAGEIITLYAVWKNAWSWLVEDQDGRYYTIGNDEDGQQVLVEIVNVSALTADIFSNYGFQIQPDNDLLAGIASPKIYRWNSSEQPEASASLIAIPPIPQCVVFNNVTIALPVKYITIIGDSSSLWNVSFDAGETWYTYDGGWVITENDGVGCVKRRLELLPNTEWALKATTQLKFRCWLGADGWTSGVRIDF